MSQVKKWWLFIILAVVAALGVGYQIPPDRQLPGLVFMALVILFTICATLSHEEELVEKGDDGPPET